MTDDDHEALVAGQADMRSEIRELRAEIERLREQVDALLLVATSHEPEALRLQAEIERLTRVLTHISTFCIGKAQQLAQTALETKPSTDDTPPIRAG